MSKFRKKPVVVEAVQWFPGSDPESEPFGIYNDAGLYLLPTISGEAQIAPGDWIIAEMDGSGHYPCKPDIFAATYEPVDETTSGSVPR